MVRCNWRRASNESRAELVIVVHIGIGQKEQGWGNGLLQHLEGLVCLLLPWEKAV